MHDVIVVQRNLILPQVWEACDYWRALGKLVCADLDDDYPRLTPQNPAYPFWVGKSVDKFEQDFGMTPIDALTEGLNHVDVLLSPNQLILDDWYDIVPGVIVNNYAKSEWYEGIEQKPIRDEIVIGWGGSVSHYDSWWFSGVKDAVPVIFERYPNVRFKFCGNDWRMLTCLEREWPEGRWMHQPGVPPEEWPKQVASFDIGLAPLAGPGALQSELYDQHRSWIKASEYLLCGVPWLASPGIVYQALDGMGGYQIRENKTDAWIAAISEMINNLPSYKETSKALMGWAMENLTLRYKVEDAYIRLFERLKAEVNAERGARLPNTIYVEMMIDEQEKKAQESAAETA